MAKLCAKGKAAAKRKFKVYPSAYANMYASGVCSGKITPGGKKGSRKKAMGGEAGESLRKGQIFKEKRDKRRKEVDDMIERLYGPGIKPKKKPKNLDKIRPKTRPKKP